jgi:uncharacterized protein YlxP (DUF503 family)
LVTVILSAHLNLPQVRSLKEKRRIIKSLIARLRNDFNISIAEVASNDTHRHAVIGAAIVSNDRAYGDQVIAKVVNRIENNGDLILTEYHTEVY